MSLEKHKTLDKIFEFCERMTENNKITEENKISLSLTMSISRNVMQNQVKFPSHKIMRDNRFGREKERKEK